jgi:hypothetical protein
VTESPTRSGDAGDLIGGQVPVLDQRRQVLAEEVRRLGYHAEVIDDLAAEGDGLLALAAAVYIGAGRVKITAEALAKAEHHPLGGILDATAHENGPLRTAALVGIAVALDEGRTLKGRAA